MSEHTLRGMNFVSELASSTRDEGMDWIFTPMLRKGQVFERKMLPCAHEWYRDGRDEVSYSHHPKLLSARQAA